ncbi:hypothetical protein ABPG75_003364 [Micractinium tetrahymenae]
MTSVGLPQPLDALGPGGVDLQRLLAGLQQQRQGLPGEAAAEQSKRQRSGDAPGRSDAAGTAQPLSQPLASLAGAPLGLQLPFLPLNGGGMQAMGGLGASHAFIPTAQAVGMGMPLPASQPVPAPGMLLPPALHGLGGGIASSSMLAPPPAQLLPHAAPQHLGGVGSGSHSHNETDSAEDGSGEGQGRGGGARRTSEERLNANKEKNRRAQQRFRLRQKEKMLWLEAELQRLRALCTQHGIDPSPTAPPPAALRAPPCGTAAAATMLPLPQQAQPQAQAAQQRLAAAPPAVPGVQVQAAMQAAAAQATTAAARQEAIMQPAAAAQPSIEQLQMYEELEAMLERCPCVPAETAIAFLTAFQRADTETKRCQYRSLRRRYDAARVQEVASCIAHFLAAAEGAGTSAAAAAAAAAPAAADMHVVAKEELAAASKAPSPSPGPTAS